MGERCECDVCSEEHAKKTGAAEDRAKIVATIRDNARHKWDTTAEDALSQVADLIERGGNPQPARTRIHVGWRVVREREGVREWLSHGGHWYPSLSLGETFAPKFDMEFLRDRAQHFGGRVVRVFLSYGRGG